MSVPDRPAARSWVPALTVVGASLAVLVVLNPWLVVQANTPSGGDMGAHVLGPAFLRDVLLPEGRVMGWSNSWFAGFPAFYFYFPLPSLFIVLLDLVLPYGVAFKVVTVLGLVGLAPAMYFLTRSLGFARPIATTTAAGAAVFAFMESYSIYGGNIASSLAGEFSYSWSFSLGLVYLGLLVRAVRGEERLVMPAAVVFAMTALSHILTTLVLVVASLTVLLWKGAARIAVRIWAWAFAISAFWAVPLVARISLTSDMAWTPLSRWEEVFPVELWLLLPVAIAGAGWAARRTSRILPLVAATLVPLIYYPLPNLLPSIAPDVFGDGRFKLWNGRLLPYWYWGVIFFASLGVGALVMWASRRLPERVSRWWGRGFVLVVGAVATGLVLGATEAPDWAAIPVAAAFLLAAGVSTMWTGRVSSRALLTGVAASVIGLGAVAGVTFVDGWARWNYSGYEGKAVWPEYRALMETVDELPPGRIQWEANRELDKYGTPMALMLFPYWTGEHPSMEGLYFESSLTTPFHFLNAGAMSHSPSNPIPGLRYYTFAFDRGIRHLDLYGVTYYVAYTEEAKTEADAHEDLAFVAESPPWRIYRLPPTELVEPLEFEPAVYEADGAVLAAGHDQPAGFDDFALEWYADLEALDRLVTTDGPEEWERISSLEELPATPIAGEARVSDIVVDDHRISFTTTAVGIPHLVKVSYFPNWTATGAEGPYRSTPSLMVVVPTQREVVLEFSNTWAEWAGWLLTAIGVGAAAFVALTRLRQRAADSEQAA